MHYYLKASLNCRVNFLESDQTQLVRLIWSITGPLNKLFPVVFRRKEGRDVPFVLEILFSKLLDHFLFFPFGKQDISDNDNGKQANREYGGPVDDAFAKKPDKQPRVLGMPDQAV